VQKKYPTAPNITKRPAIAARRHRATSVECGRKALARSVVSDFESYVKLNKKIYR